MTKRNYRGNKSSMSTPKPYWFMPNDPAGSKMRLTNLLIRFWQCKDRFYKALETGRSNYAEKLFDECIAIADGIGEEFGQETLAEMAIARNQI